MISWFTHQDDIAAFNATCKDCENRQLNAPNLQKMPCNKHILEYANQELTVVQCEFLDPENPKLGEKYINTLIINPKDNLEFLVDHIQAEEYEGRTAVVSLTTKKITRDELNTMQEWEP